MLNGSIRILDLDGSITKQKNLLSYKNEIIDLTGFGPLARIWMNADVRKRVIEELKPSLKNAVTFIGSGDFHHLSALLLEEIKQPFSLIVFDHHPDWDALPPHLGCGSWVNYSLRNKNLLRCVLLGVASNDISSLRIQTGSLRELRNKRIEVYPYSHRPSLVFFQKGICGTLNWDELKGKDLSSFVPSLIKRLPTREVYISIDKDCLKKEYALTNWEQGSLNMDELLTMLRLIKENSDIVGVDITGDYSKVRVKGTFKASISGIDHPKRVIAENFSESEITSINEQANLKILSLLLPQQ